MAQLVQRLIAPAGYEITVATDALTAVTQVAAGRAPGPADHRRGDAGDDRAGTGRGAAHPPPGPAGALHVRLHRGVAGPAAAPGRRTACWWRSRSPGRPCSARSVISAAHPRAVPRPVRSPGRADSAQANRALTDSPLWIRRIASASAGATDSTVSLSVRLAAGIGTVLVQTISSMSFSAESRASRPRRRARACRPPGRCGRCCSRSRSQQLEDGAALGDLVVQHDHVAVGHLTDHRGDHHPVVGEALLGAGRDLDAEQPGERRRLLGVAEVRGDHDGVAQVVAAGSGAASSRRACRWSTGMLKKPWICGECSVIARSRSAPAVCQQVGDEPAADRDARRVLLVAARVRVVRHAPR